MSNKKKLRKPRGYNQYGESYLLTRRKRRLTIQLQQEHNRQRNSQVRERAAIAEEQAKSIRERFESGDLTPSEAQAELITNVTDFLKR